MRKYLLHHATVVYRTLNISILALSVGLIAYLSADALTGRSFITDSGYMGYQFGVCLYLMAAFGVEMYMSADKWLFLRRNILLLLLSIPYLNIMAWIGAAPTGEWLYFARFVSLARGALAMAVVVGYLSESRMINIFLTYTACLFAIVYLGSLIFYEREGAINPGVNGYWDALWWACADATTTGSTIFPVTPIGRVVGAVMSVMGMVMFPLFTVVVTSAVRRHLHISSPAAN